MTNHEDPIVFKDLKKSVGKKEFKAVLKVVKKEYKLVSRVLKKTSEFETSSINKMTEELDPALQGNLLLEKLTINLTNRAKNHLMESFGNEIRRSKHITDFINRFQKPGEEYPDFDLEFLKEYLDK
jgi:hypothetical protein